MQNFKRFVFIFLVAVVSLIEIKCNNDHKQPVSVKQDTSSTKPLAKKEEIKEKPIVVNISYHAIKLTQAIRDSLLASDSSQLSIVLALNRIDKTHIWKTNSIIVPDTFLTELKSYSPFPDSLPVIKGIHKIIFFAYAIQGFAAYENGALIRWGPVSMGKQSTPTPLGLFHTGWKSKQTSSTVNKEWVMNWYFNLESSRGVSMHQYDLPGYPASHACVRLREEDAYWFYYWADQWILKGNSIAAYGTPVIIFGEYPFGERRPWLALSEDNKATQVEEEELTKEAEPFLPDLLHQQAVRDSLK